MKLKELNDVDFGAYLSDLDITNVSDQDIHDIKRLISKYKFIGILDQNIDFYQYESFACKLGSPIDNVFVEPIDDHPYIIEVSRLPEEKSAYFGQKWHADFTFLPHPATYTLLLGREIPKVGGDTPFADQVRAYNNLPCDLKEYILSHTATHQAGTYTNGTERSSVEFRNSSSMKFKQQNDGSYDQKYLKPFSHPMVYTTSDGVNAIYCNSYVHFIDDVSTEESTVYLDRIRKEQLRKEYIQTLKWYPNMLAVWDNRLCLHKAPRDYTEKRILYRMLVVDKSAMSEI